jgi:antitoxin CptB
MDDSGKGGSSENRRKRLLFRAQRRGFKEVDLIFGAYAEKALPGLDEAGLDQFEALLTAPDQEVYAWLRGAVPVPAQYDNPVFAGLKAVCGRKGHMWNG